MMPQMAGDAPDTGSWSRRSARSCWGLGVPALVWRELHRRRGVAYVAAGRRPARRAVRQRHAAELRRAACTARSTASRAQDCSRSAPIRCCTTLNVVLLIVGRARLLDALLALAVRVGLRRRRIAGPRRCSARSPPRSCVYRMVDRPSPAGDLLSLSLREGAWLALLGSSAMVVGALWPARAAVRPRPADAPDAWSQLSGWTPEP